MSNLEERYNRQIILPNFGEEGQRRLQKAKILLVGVGGLGSPIALYLAGAGVGTIGIVEDDIVSSSNLQRQILYQESEIGHDKVFLAQKRISALNSQTHVITYKQRFDEENALSIAHGYDMIIDGCDNFETRYIMDRVSMDLGIPYIFGSIGEYSGMVSVFNTQGAGRYSDLFTQDSISSQPNNTKGVIGPVPGVIGSIEALEAIKIITGCGEPLCGKLFTIDLITLQSHILNI